MSGPAVEPRWLDTGIEDDAALRTHSHARTGGSAARPIAVLVVLMLAGVLVALRFTTGEDGSGNPGNAGPAQALAEEAVEPSTSVPAAEAQAPQPSQLEVLDSRFQMVVSPAGGTGNVLLTIDPETGSSVSNLPDLSHLEFDATGDWLAGLSVTAWGERRLVLWAGPAGRSLEPLSFDVSAFAWHDTQPGLIAFSGPGRTSVSFVDLAESEPARTVPLPVEGVVGGWGDWGVAVETSSPTTAIVSPDGTLVHDAIPGTYRGALPDGRLVLNGRRRGVPFAVDPVSGRTDRPDSLQTDAFAWRITDAAGSDRAVAFVSRSALRGGHFHGSIFAIHADGRLDHIGAVSAFTDLDIAADETITIFGQKVAAERSPPLDRTIAGEPTTIPLSGADWAAFISAR